MICRTTEYRGCGQTARLTPNVRQWRLSIMANRCVECGKKRGIFTFNYAGFNMDENKFAFKERIEPLILPGNPIEDFLCAKCANKRKVICKVHGICEGTFFLGNHPICIKCAEEQGKKEEERKIEMQNFEKDKKYFYSLLPETGPFFCKHENCNHLTVNYSAMCAKHHFEMILNKPCTFTVPESTYNKSKHTDKEFNEILQIISKYKHKFEVDYYRIHLYGQIPSEKLKSAKDSYASINSDETPIVLMDVDYNHSGRKGYILTDKRLFSNIHEEKLFFYWNKIDTIYHSDMKSKIFINDKPFMKCSIHRDNDWNQFLMIHEIYRSMKGESISFSADRNIKFPENCISCCSNLCENKISLKMYVPEPNWVSKNWAKAGLLGLPFGILFGGTLTKIPFEYSIPICKNCFSKLTGDEKRMGIGLVRTTLPDLMRWFTANRHMSLKILETNETISSWGDVVIEMWFRSTDFAKEFLKLNGLT